MSEPLTQAPSLVWGELSFVSPTEDTETNFEIQALAQTEFGDPIPVIETLPSLLVDGALAATTRWENREIPVYLRVSANDGESAAEAEAVLMQQRLMDQPYPLVWTSSLGNSAPVVFDVVAADLRRDYEAGSRWDLAEKLLGYRYYVLTLTCLPFARAVESTIVPALPVPVDPESEDWTDVDTCGATTGWSIESSDLTPTGPTLVTGPPTAVEAEATINNAGSYLRLVRTGAFTVPTDYYLAVDVLVTGAWTAGSWRARIDGIYLDPISITADGEDGSVRLFFDGVGSVTELAILKDFENGPFSSSGDTTLHVFNVAHTDTLGATTTTTRRQQSRLVTVDGSAPTQAAIRLYDAAPADLAAAAGTEGDILVYTTRNIDWQPNLRKWIFTSETPDPDAARISGARHTLDTDTVYLIPALDVTPGTYALMAMMDIDSPGTLTWQARLATTGGATNIVGSSVVISGEIDLETTAGYRVLNLAAMVLPTVEVEGTSLAIELTLGGTAAMNLDDAWLFSLDDGVLTWIVDDEGMDWAELRSPELGAARPSVWGGRNAVGTGAVCVDWKCAGADYGSFGVHRFEPGQMQVFTVTPATLESQCELEYFPRGGWHLVGAETS